MTCVQRRLCDEFSDAITKNISFPDLNTQPIVAKWSHMKTDHNDVIKWKHLPRYWHFVRGIHRSPINSPHKGQWRGALMFSFICARINGWVNNREAGDLRRHHAHYDDIVMHQAGLAQVMDCRLLAAKIIPEPMLTYCQLEYIEYISMKYCLRLQDFH